MCHLLRFRCYPVPHLHWRPNSPQRSLYLSSQPVREQRQRPIPMYKLRCLMCHLLRLRCYPVPHLHWRPNSPQRSLYLSSQPVREQRQRPIPMYNCDASCATCSGSAATQCLTCTGGLTPLSGACTCLPNQFVSSANGQFQCTDCDASCATCSGSAATQCLTCPSG
jgi:hypothetical protein